MKNLPFELAFKVLKLQLIIGASLKGEDVPQRVKDNLVSLSIGLSQIASFCLDFEGEPTEGE